ncbi:type I-E CRISPR-associated protein Cas6/Cse3/CasE [Streptomyces niveus]|uniref:Type I-E CRISPR-associated protein Cas6/Cse3/CasE n=1 Tax=Streptomyces niveus TaxID=193462 RepID=A0A1U9R1W2_STRNV|nr:type I-E CRISPR-associated protein Cas6/Cse3/CasE [Streptomyces niveus]AQU70081.1 type I-E CRISPR-associated protein Cas6/Cse3/CasE [Streptomyces niveus]
MTYLSRIRLNPLRTESRKLLANPGAMHGAVMGGLPGTNDNERVLWRLDADDPYRPHLFVLTRSRPDWTHIVEQAGWPDADGDHAAVRDYTPLLTQIATGREFAFRLTASPVQNTQSPRTPTPAQAARIAANTDTKRTRGFRMGHRTAAAQLDWFLSRTDRWGFDFPASRTDAPAPGLETPLSAPAPEPAASGEEARHANPPREVRITARNRHSFKKNGNGATVTFRSATFEGRLRVTDPQAFTTCLLQGIGPSKAHGCGLLTLAPLQERTS